MNEHIERCSKHGREFRVRDGCPVCDAKAAVYDALIRARLRAIDADAAAGAGAKISAELPEAAGAWYQRPAPLWAWVALILFAASAFAGALIELWTLR